MKRFRKLLIIAILTAATVFGATCFADAAVKPWVTNNRFDNSYYNYASVTDSYLEPVTGGYMRVEYSEEKGKVIVEYYDNSFNIQSRKYITPRLEIFGGFFAGKKNYYIISGSENREEDDTKSVFRITKYSKDWEVLGSTDVKKANTTVPFDAGRAAFAENDGYLYVRTCHEMYTSSDKLNHQANVTFVIKESDMELMYQATSVLNSDYGYVSHSFNQFLDVTPSGTVIAADHGDAYPREVTVFELPDILKQGVATQWGAGEWTQYPALIIQGQTGDNYTGVNIGGLAATDDSYLVVGKSVKQDENWSTNNVENVFVSVVRPDEGSSALKWLTFNTREKYGVGNPQLVKFDEDTYLVMWDKVCDNFYTKKISYVFIDSRGRKISEVFTAAGATSDCKPIVKNDRARWYVTSGETIKFYSIDRSGKLTVKNAGVVKAPAPYAVYYGSKSIAVSVTPVSKDLDGCYIYRASTYNGTYKKIATLKDGGSYLYYVDNNIKAGKTYYYKVRYFRGKQTGELSSYVKVKP